MRFTREIFMDTVAEIQWLLETHLKHVVPPPAFASFTLAGYESAPERIDLYASRRPLHNEHPFAVYQNEDGVLVLLPPAVKTKR